MMPVRLLVLAAACTCCAVCRSAAAADAQKTFEIAPGVLLPWISNGAVGYPSNSTETAAEMLWLKNGGRGLDTAWSYQNQMQVGAAISRTTVQRSDIFLTTKVSNRMLCLSHTREGVSMYCTCRNHRP